MEVEEIYGVVVSLFLILRIRVKAIWEKNRLSSHDLIAKW
jgi:hypothetical protein